MRMLHFACLVPKAIQVTLPSLSFYRNTSEKNDYISIKIYHFINSGERKLTKSILNFNKWEKGQTDLCEFVFADLGEIEFVTIGLYHLSGNWTLLGKKHGYRLTYSLVRVELRYTSVFPL